MACPEAPLTRLSITEITINLLLSGAFCTIAINKEKNMEAAQILEEADIIFSDNAAKKVSDLIQEEKNNDFYIINH
jgi:hypothetical protein